jgi:prepilin-type N-terminal cleavage/methylation domain-containing protein
MDRCETDRQNAQHHGFTLVETIVVLAILGLLAALILPAIQQVREASRRLQCVSNLRQIGIGLNNYLSTYGVLPEGKGSPNPRVDLKQYSVFTRLLPYLDMRNEFYAINFECGLDDFYMFSEHQRGFESNLTAMSRTIGLLLCPSDSGPASPGVTGGTNYRANLGTDATYYTSQSKAGPFSSTWHGTLSSIQDGMSRTVAICERLRGSGADNFDPETSMLFPHILFSNYYQTFENCKYQDASLNSYTACGLTWFVGSYSQTCYNHVLPPNGESPDCISPATNPVSGFVGARSAHPGGVCLLMVDGSSHFTKDSIHIETWRSLGTAAGGEIVGDE